MDKTAIQEISRLAVASFDGAAPLNDGSAIVIPDNYKIQNLERFEATPKAFKGTFSTTVLDEFISYVNKNGNENSNLFIDQQEMTAEAILDQGDSTNPLWGRHRATLKLLKTPAYIALLKLQNQALTQQDFIDFAEDWRDNISFFSNMMVEGHEVIGTPSLPAVIKILRKLKISANHISEQNINNHSSSHSALEAIEINSDQNELPEGFIFDIMPYEGFKKINFYCQLRAVSDDKTVKLKYRIGQLNTIAETIANEFKDYLFKEIDQELNDSIYIGKMNYQD